MNNIKLYMLTVALCCIFIMSGGYCCAQQPGLYSSRLRALYDKISDSISSDIETDTVVFCQCLAEEPIHVAILVDGNGFIYHIGWQFINVGDGNLSHDPIVRFLERIFLEMLLADDLKDLLNFYSVDNLHIKVDGVLLDKWVSPSYKNDIYKWINPCVGININRIGTDYDVELVSDNGHTVTIYFNSSGELIYGMNKKELDMQIAYQLSHCDAVPDFKFDAIDSSSLVTVNDSLWVLEGGTYLSDAIKGDIYFSKGSGKFAVLYDSKKTEETLSNIMLCGLPDDQGITFQIRHNTYSGTVAYSVSNNAFHRYFSEGYEKFFGISTWTDDKFEGTLFIKDKIADNVHMAVVSSSCSDIFENRQIDILLYTNIPQQNLIMKELEYYE